MKVLAAILVKLALLAIVLGGLLRSVFGLSPGGATVAVLVIWLGSFLIVDAIVVPAAGALPGALADLALVALALWAIVHHRNAAVVEVAAAVALAEYAFHVYLLQSRVFARQS